MKIFKWKVALIVTLLLKINAADNERSEKSYDET